MKKVFYNECQECGEEGAFESGDRCCNCGYMVGNPEEDYACQK
jgi:hypothetical protein